MKKKVFTKKTLVKNLTSISKIIGLILLAVIPALLVFTYLDIQKEREKAFLLGEVNKLKEKVQKLEITPTSIPSPIPVPKSESTQTGTQTKYSFSSRQYEASIANINHTDKTGGNPSFFEFDLMLKNISVTPFIIDYSIMECEVLKDGNLTKFTSVGSKSLDKGLLPGESKQDRLKLYVMGVDYDASGNKITPSGNLKLRTCKIYPHNSISTYAEKLEAAREQKQLPESSIEPKTIQFPN